MEIEEGINIGCDKENERRRERKMGVRRKP